MGIALSGLGLFAFVSALGFLPVDAVSQGPLLESSSELSFLEEWWKAGQGKGYPWSAPTPQLLSSELLAVKELIATSPKARRSFPRTDEISELFQFIVAKSQEFGVSPLLVLSMIEVESGFQPGVVSSRGAVGLMQLLPATAQEVAQSSGMIWYPELLNDPKINIELGLRYMKKLKEQFENVDDVLLAYNFGPGTLRERRDLGEDLSRDYVQRVKLGMRRYGHNLRIPRKHKRLWAKAWL